MKKTVSVVFILTLLTLMSTVNHVYASCYQGVFILIAYDEEFEFTARYFYGNSPQGLASIFVTEVSWRFENVFNIKFIIAGYMFWDSDDAINNINDLLDECIRETGYRKGMTYNGQTIDILVIFSDQETHDAWGIADKVLQAVLVYETYYILSNLQATDNILQHELSHLYGCLDEKREDLNCIMNNYRVRINLFDWVPQAFTTERWCSSCINIISNNRAIFGKEISEGGGRSIFWTGEPGG